MTDNKQFQQVQEATWNVVHSLRDTNQMVADNLVTLQDRNLRFVQSSFLNWMEFLTYQTQSVQQLQQQWGQQVRKQQEAIQELASASMRIYMDFLLTPFAFSRQLVDVTEDTLQKERQHV
jgi:hypothetical protein